MTCGDDVIDTDNGEECDMGNRAYKYCEQVGTNGVTCVDEDRYNPYDSTQLLSSMGNTFGCLSTCLIDTSADYHCSDW